MFQTHIFGGGGGGGGGLRTFFWKQAIGFERFTGLVLMLIHRDVQLNPDSVAEELSNYSSGSHIMISASAPVLPRYGLQPISSVSYT